MNPVIERAIEIRREADAEAARKAAERADLEARTAAFREEAVEVLASLDRTPLLTGCGPVEAVLDVDDCGRPVLVFAQSPDREGGPDLAVRVYVQVGTFSGAPFFNVHVVRSHNLAGERHWNAQRPFGAVHTIEQVTAQVAEVLAPHLDLARLSP